MIIGYIELDRELSDIFSLSQESVFVLSINKDNTLLEFVHPPRLKGNMIPLDNRSAAGRAASNRRSYISNNVQGDRDFAFLAPLMGKKGNPIQKIITYPVVF